MKGVHGFLQEKGVTWHIYVHFDYMRYRLVLTMTIAGVYESLAHYYSQLNCIYSGAMLGIVYSDFVTHN